MGSRTIIGLLVMVSFGSLTNLPINSQTLGEFYSFFIIEKCMTGISVAEVYLIIGSSFWMMMSVIM